MTESEAVHYRPAPFHGAIAQLGERLHGMQEVGGSIPPGSTIPFFRAFVLGGLAALLLSACGGPATTAPPTTGSENAIVSAADLQTLAQRRVLFAHQSVGFDILDGVRELAAANGVSVPIVEGRQPAENATGIFHFRVGHNEDPQGKIADYVKTVEAGGTQGVDVAILKFCYIDFTPDTDGKALAERYLSTLQTLQAQHPATVFVAVTAPLTVVQTGPKAWMKRLMGRSPAGLAENARRGEFNELVRQRVPANRLFDLAHIEAHGATPEALDPALTVDGGHLNDRGKQLAAAGFVRFVAGAERPQT